MTEYKIKDLTKGMRDIELVAEVDFLGEKRSTSGFDNDIFVHGYVKDETGEIKMTFWNDDIKKAKPGKKFRIKKGYTTTYNGELQLNVDKETPLEFI